MLEEFKIGDRVEIFLHSSYWESEGWYPGTLSRIDPYSAHRFFYWVDLDKAVQPRHAGLTRLVSVINPKNIRKYDLGQRLKNNGK
jgi:hypothetical protein